MRSTQPNLHPLFIIDNIDISAEVKLGPKIHIQMAGVHVALLFNFQIVEHCIIARIIAWF